MFARQDVHNMYMFTLKYVCDAHKQETPIRPTSNAQETRETLHDVIKSSSTLKPAGFIKLKFRFTNRFTKVTEEEGRERRKHKSKGKELNKKGRKNGRKEEERAAEINERRKKERHQQRS